MLKLFRNHESLNSLSNSGDTAVDAKRQPLQKPVLWSALVLAFLFAVTSLAARSPSNTSLNQHNSSNPDTADSSIKANLMLPEIDASIEPSKSRVTANVEIKSSSKSEESQPKPEVNLKVNNQEISIPESGEVSQTTTADNGQGTVNVNVRSNLSESSKDDKTRIRIKSKSESEVKVMSSF